MRILSRHLVARFLVLFSLILVLLLLAVLVGDMLLDFSSLLDQSDKLGVAGALLRYGLRTPARYLPILAPVASFGAAFLSVGLAARSLEVIAMKAGGISPLRAVAPLLGCAVCLAAVTLVLNETLVVEAARVADRVERGSSQEIALRRGSFWYRSDHRIINIDASDPATQTLRGVTIYERDDRGRLVRSIRAASAVVEKGNGWVLHDVIVRSFDLASPTAAPGFERLPELRIDVTARSTHALFDARASTLSLRDLASVRAGRSTDGQQVRRFRAILHERLSDPLLLVVLAVFAIPLGLKVEQTRTLAVPALQGALLLVVVFTVRSLGSTLAGEGVAPPAATAWAIVAGFLAIGVVSLRRVPR